MRNWSDLRSDPSDCLLQCQDVLCFYSDVSNRSETFMCNGMYQAE